MFCLFLVPPPSHRFSFDGTLTDQMGTDVYAAMSDGDDPIFTNDRFGNQNQAIEFSGTPLIFPNSPLPLDGDSDWTINLWITQTTNSGWQSIAGFRDPNSLQRAPTIMKL